MKGTLRASVGRSTARNALRTSVKPECLRHAQDHLGNTFIFTHEPVRSRCIHGLKRKEKALPKSEEDNDVGLCRSPGVAGHIEYIELVAQGHEAKIAIFLESLLAASHAVVCAAPQPYCSSSEW